MQFELMLSVAFIGLLHLVVGIFIGRRLKNEDEPTGPKARRRLARARFNHDLAFQIDSLVRRQMAAKPDADLADRLRKLVEEIAQIVEGSRTSVSTKPPKRETFVEADAAGIASAKWFPATPLEVAHSGAEQRKFQRFAYVRKQAIAPVTGDELPNGSAFVEVLFRDLSTNGFSFYADEEFPVERLVAKLGSPPDIVTVLAQVIRQNEMWHDGRWVFHIGCEILRRLDGVSDPSARSLCASQDGADSLNLAKS